VGRKGKRKEFHSDFKKKTPTVRGGQMQRFMSDFKGSKQRGLPGGPKYGKDDRGKNKKSRQKGRERMRRG